MWKLGNCHMRVPWLAVAAATPLSRESVLSSRSDDSWCAEWLKVFFQALVSFLQKLHSTSNQASPCRMTTGSTTCVALLRHMSVWATLEHWVSKMAALMPCHLQTSTCWWPTVSQLQVPPDCWLFFLGGVRSLVASLSQSSGWIQPPGGSTWSHPTLAVGLHQASPFLQLDSLLNLKAIPSWTGFISKLCSIAALEGLWMKRCAADILESRGSLCTLTIRCSTFFAQAKIVHGFNGHNAHQCFPRPVWTAGVDAHPVYAEVSDPWPAAAMPVLVLGSQEDRGNWQKLLKLCLLTPLMSCCALLILLFHGLAAQAFWRQVTC